jgi:hypothetical protein
VHATTILTAVKYDLPEFNVVCHIGKRTAFNVDTSTMRLINTHEFPPKVPKDIVSDRKYAILSHTWGEDEVTLGDLREPEQDYESASWKKIRGAQEQATQEGLDWIWIDTLCIDKSSSAELSEAINSMYKWYQDAEVCYVYLSDLPGCPPLTDEADQKTELIHY